MKSSNKRKNIHISVSHSDGEVKIFANDDIIEIDIQSPLAINSKRLDYTVWFILPIAMACNADITVDGAGSQTTIDNAYKISSIWESWLPSKFNAVKVSFSELCDDTQYKKDTGNLCFYSGGVDSTYSILKLSKAGQSQSLLTVHGMDYKYTDAARFEELTQKTQHFANSFGDQRIYIKTNAYALYKQYKINTSSSHISHIFALAGSAFLFSEHFSKLIIAADYRLDQQFLVYPWGSNSATNHLFDDGSTCLETADDDVTRSDKMPSLLASQDALSALSFCKDYKTRPNNCGVCRKCMRTKLMFFAATGTVPKIFLSVEIDPYALNTIDLNKNSERTFFIDLYSCAKKNERLELMPYLAPLYTQLKKINSTPPKTKNSASRFFRKIRTRKTKS